METKCLVFRFADIEVREREFSIAKAGEVLPVEPKAFRVLLFLLRTPHRLITKDELLDAVWTDCEVSENSLTRSIALLRRLLGDDTRNPRYIATVPTVGYRFLCDVETEEDRFSSTSPAPRSNGLAGPHNGSAPDRPTQTPAVHAHPSDPTAAAQRTAVDQAEEKLGAPSTPDRRRSYRGRLYGLIAAALLLAFAGPLAWRGAKNRDLPAHQRQAAVAGSSKDLRIVPLTNLPGAVADPSFSSDGEKIAFIWYGENPGKGDVYVQLVGGEKPLRLTHTASGFTCCADWSPDGRRIAFGRCDDNGGGVFTVPALGGPERKLTEVECPFGDAGYPKWIEDGKALLLVDRCVPAGPRGIMVFSLETGEKRCLAAPPPSSNFGDSSPVLSPDQKTVAFLSGSTVGTPELFTLALSGGDPRQLTHQGTAGFNPMWSSDGQRILFDSTRSGLLRVWQVPAAGGAVKPEMVYPGTGSLSRDGRRLAYVDPPGFLGRSLVIWRLALSGPGGRILSQGRVQSSDGGNNAPQPSPDGRQIVFESCRTGRCEIWKSDTDGSDPLQLTFFDKGFPGTPRWSSDGKWIAFDHHPERYSQIYLIDSEGRNLHTVTSGNYQNVVPSWSRDGAAIYFASNRTGTWQVWRRKLATEEETQVTHYGGFAAFESYDGKSLYYSRFDGGGIWSMPVGGGDEGQVTDALHRGYWGDFAVTEKGIYLLDSDAIPKPTIKFYNFQSRLLTPVFQLPDDPVPWEANLAASRDGRTVLFAQGIQHNSITMAENFE
jgi:Tol biopolymer transport system component/DNA-binding winged helix-turn-helix (wHTH) protein